MRGVHDISFRVTDGVSDLTRASALAVEVSGSVGDRRLLHTSHTGSMTRPPTSRKTSVTTPESTAQG
jgi:hypothetical protein